MLGVEAGRIIESKSEGCVVIVTMSTIFSFPNSEANPLTLRCAPLMGGASSIGLGIALAQPTRKVLVLDGDGSLLMQLGSLATVVGAKPANFYHFVFHNRHLYEGGGRIPLPTQDVDFELMARAAGYKTTVKFDTPESLTAGIDGFLASEGPAFAALDIAMPDGARWSNAAPQGELPEWWFSQMREDGASISQTLGV